MKLIILISLLICYNALQAQSTDDLLGRWLTGNRKAHVKIEKKGNPYSGKIVFLKEPNEAGKPKVDKNNSKPELKTKPIIGLNLYKDFVYDEDALCADGTIYDSENGKTYSCKITIKEKNTIEACGFIGFSLLGRTDVWKIS